MQCLCRCWCLKHPRPRWGHSRRHHWQTKRKTGSTWSPTSVALQHLNSNHLEQKKQHLVNNMATASLAWGLQVGIGFRLMSSLEVWPLPWNMQPCNSYNSVSGWILQVGNYRWTERQWWWLYVLADLWQYSVALLLLQELVLGWDTNGDFLSGTFFKELESFISALQRC